MENGNLGVHIHKELSAGFARGGFHYKKQTGGVASIRLFGQVSAEEKRVDVANARAEIYELQWKRIGILKEMGNRKSLVEAINDYCTIIGYNQDKAKTMLNSLESE